MATITKDRPCLTLINTFEVEPARADELVDLLVRITDKSMRGRDGFISASIHVSQDGTRVVNYAQWRDKAAFDAMLADPEAQPHMREAADLSIRFTPVLYDLVDSIAVD